jgi:hypothetical protein
MGRLEQFTLIDEINGIIEEVYKNLHFFINATLNHKENEYRKIQDLCDEHDKNIKDIDDSLHFQYLFEYKELDNFEEQIIKSTFILSFSQFESILNLICKESKQLFSLTLSLDDISGQGLKLYEKYLVKIIELNLDNSKQLIDKIFVFNEIRNKVVHQFSKIENNNLENMRNKISSNKIGNIYITSDGYIVFDKMFVDYFLEVSKTLLNKIVNVLKEKYDLKKNI